MGMVNVISSTQLVMSPAIYHPQRSGTWLLYDDDDDDDDGMFD